MAKVRYVGPIDVVLIDVNGTEVEVKRNHTVEVPDDIAGSDPEPRLHEAMLELEVARIGGDHQWQRDLRDEIAGLDYGTGLLAQDIWQAVEPKAKAKAADDPKG